jgi:hypothetical protein
MRAPRVLLVDNYDSFTFNVVQGLGMLGAEGDRAAKTMRSRPRTSRASRRRTSASHRGPVARRRPAEASTCFGHASDAYPFSAYASAIRRWPSRSVGRVCRRAPTDAWTLVDGAARRHGRLRRPARALRGRALSLPRRRTRGPARNAAHERVDGRRGRRSHGASARGSPRRRRAVSPGERPDPGGSGAFRAFFCRGRPRI